MKCYFNKYFKNKTILFQGNWSGGQGGSWGGQGNWSGQGTWGHQGQGQGGSGPGNKYSY